DMVEHHDAVAGLVLAHVLADGGYHTRRFMAEDPRRRVGTGGDFLEIGATDPAGVHADQNLAGPDRRYGHRFHADVVDAAVHGGVHGGWNRFWIGLDRVLPGYGHRRIVNDDIKEFAVEGARRRQHEAAGSSGDSPLFSLPWLARSV